MKQDSNLILRKQRRKKKGGRLKTIFIIVSVTLMTFYAYTFNKALLNESSEKSIPEISASLADAEDAIRNGVTTGITKRRDDRPSSRKTHSLPDLRKGGIVVFYHMPKTGGTTLRHLAKVNQQIEFHSNKKVSMEKTKKLINQWTLSNDIIGEGQKVKFVELHYALESFVVSNDDLTKWRANAKENNIPFFVFTVLREPVEAFISFFNFFCIYLGKAKYVDCLPPHDFSKMLEISPDNPQARWLCFATTLSLQANNDKSLVSNRSIDSCASGDLLGVMDSHFDWIGIKSRLRDTSAVFQTMGIALGYGHKNKVTQIDSFLKSSTMTSNEIETLESLVKEDSKIYDWAESFYTLQNFGIDTKV